MISIWQPRYRDRVVLIARYKIPCGQDIDIEIIRGAYKGKYHISNNTICNSQIETMMSKAGKLISMRAIPLDKLERV